MPSADESTSPAPRTILYTGKGGVGKTSVAAATGRACAAKGLRTIVASTDPAHSLGDSLEAELGPDPLPVGPRLWAQQIEAQREMEANWTAVRDWLGKVLADRGMLSIAAEELTVPPGMDELFSLLQISEHHASGDYDVIVVDCAPTGETLRLLSFPDVAKWWLDRVLPWERRLLAAARPIARGIFDLPMPDEEVIGDVRRLVDKLVAVNDVLRDRERTSIRLVLNPDRMVIREAQRTFTYLSLYGYLTDAVVVNRVFPAETEDSYFGSWRRRQAESLTRIEADFAPVPVLTARYFPEEVVGARMLDRLAAELYEEAVAEDVLHDEIAHQIRERDGVTTISIPVPFAARAELDLNKVGQELIVRAGREKRTIILPSALARHRPSGAKLEDGRLEVSFEDDRSGGADPERQPPPAATTDQASRADRASVLGALSDMQDR